MVDSPHLSVVGAAWDAGPAAGAWIAARLGPFGPTLGHAVPHGYDAYAVVPLRPHPEDPDVCEPADRALARVLDVLAARTGDQPVHCALWEGWGFLYDAGDDPRTAPGMGVLVVGHDDPAEHDRALAAAQEDLARRRVERPAAARLELPHRAYHLWTGPLRSALALPHGEVPSFVWPEDRSWCVGAPIYTREIAVGGSAALVDALLAAPDLAARRATPDDVLAIDD